MDNSEIIKNRFAEEAKNYRKEAPLVNYDSEELFAKLLWIINKIFKKDDKIKVLDIGSGNGMLSEIILKNYPHAEITLLDFSPEMLESASAYFHDKNISNGNIKYVVSNFITDSFPSEKYDLIISSYALHHIRNEETLKEVFTKIAESLRDSIGTFLCVDMFLATSEEGRKRQVNRIIDKWTENFGSHEQAINWGKILEGEDSPATIPTIIASLYQCRSENYSIIPLLINQSGDMATIYGMTKLTLDELKKHNLYDLVWSWRDNVLPIGVTENEYKIDKLAFCKESDDSFKNVKKM